MPIANIFRKKNAAAEKLQRAAQVLQLLRKEYPTLRTPLTHKNNVQLLIAVILSAQCTDEQVNKVTPDLFRRYKSVRDFAQAELEELQHYIRRIGLFRGKAKNIIGCCRRLVTHYDGKVPDNLDDLVSLPGVGRKTANVILGACFDKPGLVVDTHVKRLSRLLGLTRATDPTKVEFELMPLLPPKDWHDFSLALIFHGRRVCIARRPRCADCVLCDLCPSAKI